LIADLNQIADPKLPPCYLYAL